MLRYQILVTQTYIFQVFFKDIEFNIIGATKSLFNSLLLSLFLFLLRIMFRLSYYSNFISILKIFNKIICINI